MDHSEKIKTKTKLVVEEFVQVLKDLSWTNPPTYDGTPNTGIYFKHPCDHAISITKACRGGRVLLNELRTVTVPKLADKHDVSYYASTAPCDNVDSGDGYAWSEVERDPRVWVEVERLCKEARKASKTRRQTREAVRRAYVVQTVQGLHANNVRCGLTHQSSLEMIRQAVDELTVEDTMVS